MKLLQTLYFLFAVSLLPLVVSCKPGTPKGIIKQGKMENILYDYHLAQAMAQQVQADSVDYYLQLYRQAVFQKYGISKTAFDSSMVWYERHTDVLGKMYARLAERFGGSADGGNAMGNLSLTSVSGDTLNVWKGASSVLLNSKGVNRYVYTQRADTAIKAGDRLQWHFNTEWFYHEGERRAVAVITLQYEGDSVSVQTTNVYSSGSQSLSVTIGNKKVKSIRCFIYQCAPWSDRLRMLLVNNVRLYRMRTKDVLPIGKNNVVIDTNMVVSPINMQKHIRDSLLREDTLNRERGRSSLNTKLSKRTPTRS